MAILAKVTPTDENAGYLVVHGVCQHINKVDTLDNHRQTCINKDICAGGSYHFTGRGHVIGFVVLNPSLFKKKSDYVVFEHVFHCLVISISDLPILWHIVQMIDRWANMA